MLICTADLLGEKNTVPWLISRLIRTAEQSLNAAWASPGSVIDLFIDSFRSGVRTNLLLKHLVIVAFDWKAYE